MTEQELLEETVAYYHKNPSYRCVKNNGNSCFYSGESVNHKSTGCAIGRNLTKKNRKKLDTMSAVMSDQDIMTVMNDSECIKLFPEWMKDMKKGFLSRLQDLHDNKGYWTEKGISKQGINRAILMFSEYDLTFLEKY